MSEDQKLPVQDSGVAVSAAPSEGIQQVSSAASDTEGFVAPTHQDAVVPAVLSDVMQTIKTPNQDGVAEIDGAQVHPAPLASVDGTKVSISLPEGFGSKTEARSAAGGKATEGRSNAGRVFVRQEHRAAA